MNFASLKERILIKLIDNSARVSSYAVSKMYTFGLAMIVFAMIFLIIAFIKRHGMLTNMKTSFGSEAEEVVTVTETKSTKQSFLGKLTCFFVGFFGHVCGYFIKHTGKFIDNIFSKYYSNGVESSYPFIKQCIGLECISSEEITTATKIATVSSRTIYIFAILCIFFTALVFIDLIFSFFTAKASFSIGTMISNSNKNIINIFLILSGKVLVFFDELAGVLKHKFKGSDAPK